MSKVELRDSVLWHGGKRLGASSALYCYPGEEAHLGTSEGVVVCQTPARIDLLFVAGEKVVGCEVKTITDLIGSHRSRRLHRQLRTLRETVDVCGLVVRGMADCPLSFYAAVQLHPKPEEFWGDWVNWQTQGVYLLPVAMAGYMPELLVYRGALATAGLRALAGTDIHPARERRPGWLLRRIPGIGDERSRRLINLYGSSHGALQAALRGEVASTLGKSMEERLCQAASQ
jgi:hypothetical protein